MKTCQSCGANVPDEARFCSMCGSVFAQPTPRTCRVCRKELRPNDEFCPACGFGMPLKQPSGPAAPPGEQPRQQIEPYNAPPAPGPVYAPAPAPNLYGTSLFCKSCGNVMTKGQKRCQMCGAKVHGREWAKVSGVILMLIGIINAVTFGIAAMGALLMDDGVLFVSFTALTAVNVFVIWTGMLAMKRKKFKICVLGAVASIFSLLFVLSIVAILFLLLGKDEFD